ncbi:MAG: YceI family protein [Bacteroidetes bacterium]|nr:MAG: YceI family protein [Bacteroidota bacterium]
MIKLLFLFVLLTYQTTPQSGTAYYYTNTAKVNFNSDAPQELIKASSNSLRGLIDVEKKTFVYKVLIRTFTGFNSALQREHFNEKFLESEKYPEALFTGKIIEDINFDTPGTYTIRAKGKLIIHGVEQERIIKTELTIKGGEIVFSSKFTVLLADFNIKVPKVVHEKIASEISVDVEGILKKKILQE